MDRLGNILKNEIFKDSLERNYVREKNRYFCSHDLQHVIDVSRITYILILEETALGKELPGIGKENLKEVVYAAGLLHDIARWKEYDTGEDHAKTGASMVIDVLDDCGFSGNEIKLITEAISLHRTRNTGGSLLAECLRRADDLSRPCWTCSAVNFCKKYPQLETAEQLCY